MFDCPVSASLEQALQTAKTFRKTMRKLRRSLLKCGQCGQADDCPLLKEVNSSMRAAVEEVTLEWELSDDVR